MEHNFTGVRAGTEIEQYQLDIDWILIELVLEPNFSIKVGLSLSPTQKFSRVCSAWWVGVGLLAAEQLEFVPVGERVVTQPASFQRGKLSLSS